jgi:uncharacterized membrane protein
MKQDVFIQQLRQELGSLPKEAVDEIVADYREYIGDALAAGRQEEEVIAALGDPVKLARELKAQANYRQWEKRRSFGNLMRVVGAVAGLGLLPFLLLAPFLLYLLVLTLGYVISGGLAIAGFVMLLTFASHHLFGTPSLDAASTKVVDIEGNGSVHISKGASAANATDMNEKAADALNDFKDLRVEGSRFVLDLHDGSKASVVTKSGPLSIHKEDSNLVVSTPNEDARKLLTQSGDGTLSIERDDVVALDMKDDDDGRVSYARSGSHGNSSWRIENDDGDEVSFQQDANGNTKQLVLKSDGDSVVFDGNNLSIGNDKDHIHVTTTGGSSFGGVKLGYALAMLAFGVLGWLLCVRLTRITWRALTRYVKHQIDIISAGLDREPTA